MSSMFLQHAGVVFRFATSLVVTCSTCLTLVAQSASQPTIQQPFTIESIGDKEPGFFTEPVEEVRKPAAVPTEETNTDTIRLLGIIRPSVPNATATALFRIEDQFVALEDGQRHDGITIRSIDCQTRTVLVEQQGQTVSIHLSSQPIVNQAPPQSRSATSRRTDERANLNRGTMSSAQASGIPSAIPNAIDLPQLSPPGSLPSVDLQLPTLPELPGLPDVLMELKGRK
ncbi:hypothetical protein [Rhodopirellula sp. MGV]|uniref:hypothetical protein n=1 Tax=Rhodopirellula sp. MGV TaxID=2023130 RepID=UPI000B966EE1|nr:hypothetical protein [Rhodopirellula sp. MGV]OYP34435.1 hypothetical protein CGZ80_15420 [Rhodopirellula sp. MGV]PNY37389.1 hypothetical protein C2E31_07600 [Rhodopirellula baltica]